jgi:hypothetical protein
MKKRLFSILIIFTIVIGSGVFFIMFFPSNLHCENGDCMDKWIDDCIIYWGEYYHDTPNGCSVPFYARIIGIGKNETSTPYGGNWDWTKVCNQHDICYMTDNSNRNSCDRKFYINLMESKSDKGIKCKNDVECALWAWGYYEAVVEFGEDVFEESQDDQEEFLECLDEINYSPSCSTSWY